MLKIRCLVCNTEVQARPGKSSVCNCANIATIRGDTISAKDLSKVIIVSGIESNNTKNTLSNADIMWHEARKKRGVKRLTFEER